MSPDMQKAIEDAVAKAIKPLSDRLDRYNERLKKAYRQRNLAMTTATLCLVAAAFSVGYAVKSQEALSNQTEVNRIVVCANAKSTALAFRSPQVTESKQGVRRRETKSHFLERMVAQRETLIAAGNLSCPDIKGFDSFEYLRGQALSEIDKILIHDAPKEAHELGAGEEEGADIRQRQRHRATTGSVDSGVSTQGSVAAAAPPPTTTSEDTVPSTGTHTGSHTGSTATHHPSPSGGHHGGGTHVGTHKTPHPHPAPAPEAPEAHPEPTPISEPAPSGGTGGGTNTGTGEQGGSTGSETETTTPPAEPSATKPKLLPEVIGPVEELACGLTGKLVCHE